MGIISGVLPPYLLPHNYQIIKRSFYTNNLVTRKAFR